MKQIILGTAGHIDHGKTSLIKAITGTDTDRLKEEKERGITIELGFAALDLPSGQHLGIVDVPGHEKFVKNMVAGATGIDIVVMVIADIIKGQLQPLFIDHVDFGYRHHSVLNTQQRAYLHMLAGLGHDPFIGRDHRNRYRPVKRRKRARYHHRTGFCRIGSAQRAASGYCGCARTRKIREKYGGRRYRD